MVRAFIDQGFSEADCEFLMLDNSVVNTHEAYRSYNLFLQSARGQYIILCHQDVLPIVDGRRELDAALAALTQTDPKWGLCGNAGADASGRRSIRITDPNMPDCMLGGPFPQRVMSLDENFIVVRRDANLATSSDLSGFHWYGSDLCIIADVLGWHAYVINFHLRHKSGGKTDRHFTEAGTALRRKYAHAFRPRWQYVATRQHIYISSSRFGTFVRRGLRRLRLRLGVHNVSDR